MLRRIILYIVMIIPAVSALGQSLAQQADSAYNGEEYARAIELYRQSIATEGASSGIWYNLGNAYYRHGNLGQAVISYERALKLNPANADARFNLKFVNSRIQDKPEDDSSFLTNVYNDLRSLCSPDAWAWIAFGVFVAFLAAVALYVFTHNVLVRKIGFFGGFVLLALSVFGLVLASDAKREATSHRTAVVIVPTTNLSSKPRAARLKTDKVVPIHEGTKVEVIDSVSTPDDPRSSQWYEVKINNSTTAWLRASDVEKI